MLTAVLMVLVSSDRTRPRSHLQIRPHPHPRPRRLLHAHAHRWLLRLHRHRSRHRHMHLPLRRPRRDGSDGGGRTRTGRPPPVYERKRVIRAGPGRGDLRDYIASLDRTAIALADLKRTNLRSNEKAVAQLAGLLKLGNKQLEDVFRSILQNCSREKVQPLEYVAKSTLGINWTIPISLP